MKKIYALIMLLLVFGSGAHAQFTLNGSDFPTAGETFVMTTSDSSYFIPGGTGMGQTYLESHFSDNGGTVTDSFLNVSHTPFAQTYTASNLALHEVINGGTTGNSDYFIYFNKTGSSIQRVGSVTSTGVNPIVYSNPGDQYYFPITYGNTFFDSYSGAYPSTGSTTTHVNGTDTAMADGFGTLYSPLGTFNNVMRVRTWRTEIDTITPGNFVAKVFDIYWDWYQAGTYYPIFRFNRTILSSSFTNQYMVNIAYRMGDTSAATAIATVGGEPVKACIFPNPAVDNTTLMLDHNSNNPLELTIYSMDGRLIRNAGVITGIGMQSALINTSGLTTGLYLLEIKDNTKKSYLKLHVVR